MPFKKGQSGNPTGRPPSGQAYTEILKKIGNQTIEYQGKRVSKKRLLSMYLWELVTTRKVTFPDGTVITAPESEWLENVWRLIERVDGLPLQRFSGDVTHSEKAEVKPIDYRAAIAPLAPRSMGDSETPGESEDSVDGPEMG